MVGPELLPYEERLEEVGNSAWSRDFSLEEGCFHRLFTALQDKRMRDNKHKPNEMFDPDIRSFFPTRTHWLRLPRRAVLSPSMEVSSLSWTLP